MDEDANKQNLSETDSSSAQPDNTNISNQPPQAATPDPINQAPVAQKEKKSSKLFAVLGVIVLIVIIGAIAALLVLGTKNKSKTVASSTKPPIRIGLSLDSLLQSRWSTDRDDMVKYGKQNNAVITVLVANSDDNAQISQINNLIAQKVNVLIIVAHNPETVAPTIATAHAAGIKVIAYDRMITNSAIDYYDSYDSTKVGELEAQNVLNAVPKTVSDPQIAIVDGSSTDNNATLVHNGIMKVLQPLVSSNKASIVFDQYTPNWDPDTAYANIKNLLASGKHVDAIICANDSMADGVAQALTQAGLLGKVPFSGQDADLSAVQRVVAGTQAVSVYKPIDSEAKQAILAAVAFAHGRQPQTTGTVNNGRTNVPSFLLTPIAVTKNNVKSTVIKDGFLSAHDVYGTTAQ